MNFFAQNFQSIVLAIIATILIIQGVRTASSKVANDTITAYESQSKLNKDMIASQATQINTMSTEIGRLTGIVSERDKQLIDYKQTIENRNPQLETILTSTDATMKAVVKFMESLDARLKEIEVLMKEPIIATTTIK